MAQDYNTEVKPVALALSGQVRINLYKLKGELEKITHDERREAALAAFGRAYDAAYEIDNILNR